MLPGDQVIRYSRHLLMEDFGEDGQRKLLNATVLVVGLGGLGSPAALYLAAAGVGRLLLADGDHLELTNLQRQILYTSAECGAAKSGLAGHRLEALNPDIQLETIDERLGADDLDHYVPEADLVLDCSDNIATRHAVNRACREHRVPLITAAAIRWEGQICTFDFRRHSVPCFSCLVPEGTPEPAANCGNSGVVGPVLGVMGSMQALEAIKLLIDSGHSDHGQLRQYNGKQNKWISITINPNPDCPVCAR